MLDLREWSCQSSVLSTKHRPRAHNRNTGNVRCAMLHAVTPLFKAVRLYRVRTRTRSANVVGTADSGPVGSLSSAAAFAPRRTLLLEYVGTMVGRWVTGVVNKTNG